MPPCAAHLYCWVGLLLLSIVRQSGAVLSPDVAIVADASQLLSGALSSWTASSATWGIHNLPAHVPGDLLSDLQRSGVIGDPWFELGFLNTTTPGAQGSPLWDVGNWTFSTTFAPSASIAMVLAAGGSASIVFDGVKMAAYATLNGEPLGTVVNDQFLRFVFPANLVPCANQLTVTFSTSRDVANAEGRFSGASAGWVRAASPSLSTRVFRPSLPPSHTGLGRVVCHEHWRACSGLASSGDSEQRNLARRVHHGEPPRVCSHHARCAARVLWRSVPPCAPHVCDSGTMARFSSRLAHCSCRRSYWHPQCCWHVARGRNGHIWTHLLTSR